MICPNCEKEIAGNIAQCPHCGCHFPVKENPKQESKKETQDLKESKPQQIVPEFSTASKSEPALTKEQIQPTPASSNVKEVSELKLESLKQEIQDLKESKPQQIVPELSTVSKSEPTLTKEQLLPTPASSNVKEVPEQKSESKLENPIQQNDNEVIADSKVCPKCNKTINSNATFCKWCGSRIAKKVIESKEIPLSAKFCKHCGKSITISAVFCKHCGLRC